MRKGKTVIGLTVSAFFSQHITESTLADRAIMATLLADESTRGTRGKSRDAPSHEQPEKTRKHNACFRSLLQGLVCTIILLAVSVNQASRVVEIKSIKEQYLESFLKQSQSSSALLSNMSHNATQINTSNSSSLQNKIRNVEVFYHTFSDGSPLGINAAQGTIQEQLQQIGVAASISNSHWRVHFVTVGKEGAIRTSWVENVCEENQLVCQHEVSMFTCEKWDVSG